MAVGSESGGWGEKMKRKILENRYPPRKLLDTPVNKVDRGTMRMGEFSRRNRASCKEDVFRAVLAEIGPFL
ncbi:MAG: hypothetical protein ACK41W_08160 [Cyanobacteriota bacterium]|jgi:hypothetical protein